LGIAAFLAGQIGWILILKILTITLFTYETSPTAKYKLAFFKRSPVNFHTTSITPERISVPCHLTPPFAIGFILVHHRQPENSEQSAALISMSDSGEIES